MLQCGAECDCYRALGHCRRCESVVAVGMVNVDVISYTVLTERYGRLCKQWTVKCMRRIRSG